MLQTILNAASVRRTLLHAGVVLVLLLTACSRSDPGEEISVLEQENERLQQRLRLSTEYVEDVTRIIDEVQQNLDQIEEREGIISTISLQTAEERSRRGRDIGEELENSIADIDAYIQENKDKLAEVTERMEESEIRIESLENLVRHLTQSVAEKEETLATLRSTVNRLQADVATLNREVRRKDAEIAERERTITEQVEQLEEQTQVIEEQREEQATAFYIVGTRDDLRRKGIIEERRGGLLGMQKDVKIGTIYQRHFNPVEKALDSIHLGRDVKRAEVVSAHSDQPDLFTVDNGDAGPVLRVKDTDRFWAISEYLVVMVE
jgi:myosin heavy subunit